MTKYTEVEIGRLAEFINGFAFKPEHWSNQGKKIIRIQNLTKSISNYNKTELLVPERFIVRSGDILVSWSATIDVFEWNGEEALLNQHIFKVDFNHNLINKNYFVFALKRTINELIKKSHGSTMKHVVKGDFVKHKIPLPSLPDQIKIAHILKKVEDLITQRKESIDLLDELVKSTFLEMFGDPVMNSNKWPVESVIELADCIVPGRDKPKSFTGLTPWVTTNDLVHLGITEGSRQNIGLSDEEIAQVRAKIIPANSVIMTCVGDLGVVTVASTNMVINQQLHAFQCKSEINNYFLMYVLSFQKDFMYKVASKTTVPYMNKTNCNSIPVIKPEIEIQNSFGYIVKKVEDIKKQYKFSLVELENLYNSLSQKAFNGDLDLSKLEIDPLLVNQPINEEKALPVSEKKPSQMTEEEFVEKGLEVLDGIGIKDEYKNLFVNEISKYFNAAQLASWIKTEFKDKYFTTEMLLNFCRNEKKGKIAYFTSKELKENPKVDEAIDLKNMLFEGVEDVEDEDRAKFLNIKQYFYNAEKENFDLKLRKQDFELIKERSPKERSGIYFKLEQ